ATAAAPGNRVSAPARRAPACATCGVAVPLLPLPRRDRPGVCAGGVLLPRPVRPWRDVCAMDVLLLPLQGQRGVGDGPLRPRRDRSGARLRPHRRPRGFLRRGWRWRVKRCAASVAKQSADAQGAGAFRPADPSVPPCSSSDSMKRNLPRSSHLREAHMSERRRHRWLLPAVPLAFAALLVVAGLTLIRSPGEARAAEPKATAGFQTVDDLVLAVELPEIKKGKRPELTLELLDRDGKVVETQTPKLPGNEAASLRVAFKRPKEKLDHLKVRLTSGKKSSEVTIGSILLSKAHETTVSASSEFFAGSKAAMRCSVAGVKSVSETVPLSADVTVKLHDGKKVHTLFEGKTAADGLADVSFTVPELPTGSYKVEVLTKSVLGEEKLERTVKVQSQPKILLTTDKPLYQPGQTIHVRALALRAFDLAPAAKADVTLEIEDGKGNKVFKKTLTTSDFGIAHADFVLADEVNMGDYRIRAIQGENQSEKTVEVK